MKVEIVIEQKKSKVLLWVNAEILRSYSARGLAKARADACMIATILKDLDFRVQILDDN